MLSQQSVPWQLTKMLQELDGEWGGGMAVRRGYKHENNEAAFFPLVEV